MLSYINGALSRSALASGVLQEIRKDIILRNYPPETKLTERVLCLKFPHGRSFSSLKTRAS